MNRGSFTLLFFTVFAVFISVFSSHCSTPQEDEVVEFPNHQEDVTYVGKAVCGSCHADKLGTYVHTGMGQSFNRASKEKSAAVLFGKRVHDPNSNLSYEAKWSGMLLTVEEYIGTKQVASQPISYIIGSGQHTNSHIINRNGLLFQAPLTYYVQDSSWDLPPGFELSNSRFNRQLGEECIACHNSMPEMDGNSKFRFLTVGNGIDCERCHGPGELHVAQFSKPSPDTALGMRSIVNPKHLSWERQIDVCQRCHLQGNTILKRGKRFTDFKPGMKLSDVFEIYLPEYQTDGTHFDMANHAARFQQSKCFIQSNSNQALTSGKLTFSCITCHNPHVSVEHTLTSKFNSACYSCHQTEGCKEDAAERHTRDDNCVSCHMPVKGSRDIPHVTIHDHKIQIPQETIEENAEPSTKLVCINNPDPDEATESLAYLTYWEKFDKNPVYLKEAKKRIGVNSALRIRIYLAYLQEDWLGIEEMSGKITPETTEDYWTSFQVAKAHVELNQTQQALPWFKRSHELEPYHLEVNVQYAAALFKLDQLNEAKLMLESVIRFNPYHKQGLNNLSVILLREQNYVEALAHLKQCTKLYPNYLEGYENLADAYMRLGRTKELRITLTRILQLDPDHPTATQLMKDKKL